MARNHLNYKFINYTKSVFIRDPDFIFSKKISFKRWKSTYFVTTPIYYVNAKPHVGHLYTTLVADVAARLHKLRKPNIKVHFMTGTDEHGLKISESARRNNMKEQDFCDMVSQCYRDMCNDYSISYTDFLRTTEDRHKETVVKLWNAITKNGYIYSGEYSGWYCISDEAFITEANLETEVDCNGIRLTKDTKYPTQFITEINYKFKLSLFQNDLLHWLKSGGIVKPHIFEKVLKKWIENEEIMEDLSVSRPRERMKWGISVPNDPSQNIYVWLDALSSYLTSSGYLNPTYYWPPDLQVVGKDILRFHGIFWPAFLMAAGLEPPKCILCHSHWLSNGEKMSKSKMNVIDPNKSSKYMTSEGFRYYLLRSGVMHSDGSYNEAEAVNMVNAELAGKLGNLVSRCSGKLINPFQIFPGYSERDHSKYCLWSARDLIESLEKLPDLVCTHFQNFDFCKGIDEIMENIQLTNKFFDVEKPWELRKHLHEYDHLRIVLHITMESLRVSGILLQPIVPNISENLLNTLSVHPDQRTFDYIRPFSWQRSSQLPDVSLLIQRTVLFPRINTSSLHQRT